MPQILQSRKLWAAIIGLIFIIVNAALNQQQIDPNTVTNAVMGIIAAYMASVAVEDGMSARADAAPMTKVETPAMGGDVTVTTTPSDPPAQPFIDRTGLR